jgi:hypothetical protein
MLETLSPTTSYANPALPKFIDPHLEALQQNLIQREQSGEFAPPTFDLKKTLSAEINLSNNELNYNGFRDFTLGKNKLINEAINEYTDILSVLDNYSVSTPDQQITGGWKEKIGQKFGDFKKAVTQNNIVKFTKRGIQTVGQVAQNSINDVRKGIVGSATVNAFGGSEKVVKSGFGYNSFYADTTEHVGKSVEGLEGKINSQIQQKWSNISPEDQKIIQKIISKIAKTTNDFRQNLINAGSQGKTVTNYYGVKGEELQTIGRLTTTGAITLASAAFGPLGYAAIAGRTIVNASIGEVKGLSEQTLKSQRENLEKELVLEDLQNITLLLDNLGNQKISLATAETIRENFKKLNNKFLLTGQMEAEYLKIEAKLSPDLHPENFVPEGQEILQNSQNTNNLLSQFSNKLDATTAKVLGQEFIKTVESEFNDPKKRMLRIGMVVGASVAGLAFSAYIGRPALQGLYKTIFQHGETVTLPTQSGNIRLQSSHAPLDGYKVLSQQGDLLVVGKEGQTLPTDDEMRLAINKHFEQAPTIEGAKVSDFRTPDGKILEGVRTVAGKIDGKTGILIADQNNPVVSYDDTEIRFDKGTSGIGLDLEKYQDQTVIGKYGDQLVVADKNTSPQVIAELNRIEGIEKYNTSTTSPTTPQLGQNETSPIARGVGTPQQPVVQPATTTKGELLGFNTTALSKLNDATSRGGIGKIDILFGKGNQPDSSVSNLLTRMNASGSNISINDLKGIAQVTGLYKNSDGDLLTGADIRIYLDNILQEQGLTVQNLKSTDIDKLLFETYNVERVGGMGVGVYGGDMPSLQDVQKYQQIVEGVNQRFVDEEKLIYNPNDYSEQVFNPAYPNAEQEYGAALAEERNKFVLSLSGRNATNYNANFRIGNQARGASAWARDVYDNPIPTTTQTAQSVAGSGSNSGSNPTNIVPNHSQNLANPQPGSNVNGVVNGQDTNTNSNSASTTPNNPSNVNIFTLPTKPDEVTIKNNTLYPGQEFNTRINIFSQEEPVLDNAKVLTQNSFDTIPTRVINPDYRDVSLPFINGPEYYDVNGIFARIKPTDPQYKDWNLNVYGDGTAKLVPPSDLKPGATLPTKLEYEVPVGLENGTLGKNQFTVKFEDGVTVANSTQTTTVTSPVVANRVSYNVEAGNRPDVDALEANFNNNGATPPNQNFEQTKGLLPWEGSQNFNQLINGSPENMSHHLDGMVKWASTNKNSHDLETKELAGSIIELEKFVHGLPDDNEKKAVGFAQTAMKDLIAAGKETNKTKAEGLAKAALEKYFNETQKLLPSGATQATQNNFFSGFLGTLGMIALGGAVGFAQSRYGYGLAAARPGLNGSPAIAAIPVRLGRPATPARPAITLRDEWIRPAGAKDALFGVGGLALGLAFSNPLFGGIGIGTILGRIINQRYRGDDQGRGRYRLW